MEKSIQNESEMKISMNILKGIGYRSAGSLIGFGILFFTMSSNQENTKSYSKYESEKGVLLYEISPLVLNGVLADFIDIEEQARFPKRLLLKYDKYGAWEKYTGSFLPCWVDSVIKSGDSQFWFGGEKLIKEEKRGITFHNEGIVLDRESLLWQGFKENCFSRQRYLKLKCLQCDHYSYPLSDTTIIKGGGAILYKGIPLNFVAEEYNRINQESKNVYLFKGIFFKEID